MRDLFGDGIFAVDGNKWRHQRKLASYEFSAKVLRDFSSRVFRTNAAKLALKVYAEALASRQMDLQVSLSGCIFLFSQYLVLLISRYCKQLLLQLVRLLLLFIYFVSFTFLPEIRPVTAIVPC